MKPAFSFFVLFLILFDGARAASLDRDLGRGLVYHRIHQLPADLPPADPAHRQPCVLDLRYVHPEADAVQPAAQTLLAWIKFHASPRAPVFVLANADTSPALLAPLVEHQSAGSVIVIGAEAPGFKSDIALKIAPTAERRAYDALESGASLDSLLVENPHKPRNDEAQLAKDRQPDPAPFVRPPAAAVDSAPLDGQAEKSKPPMPSIDVALQRAVQIHRTLLALKKL